VLVAARGDGAAHILLRIVARRLRVDSPLSLTESDNLGGLNCA
jgi:hypothetical protein